MCNKGVSLYDVKGRGKMLEPQLTSHKVGDSEELSSE